MRDATKAFSKAEQRLVDATRTWAICDFAGGAKADAEEMASWGGERTVRASLLRRLLDPNDSEYSAHGVQLRRAVIDGFLDLAGMTLPTLDLHECRIQALSAKGATFTGDARFSNATIANGATFDEATFTNGASFHNTTLRKQRLIQRSCVHRRGRVQ